MTAQVVAKMFRKSSHWIALASLKNLETKKLSPVQLQIHVELQDDDELIHMAQGTDAGRVVVSRFNPWIPRITAKKDSLHGRYISPFLKRSQTADFQIQTISKRDSEFDS